MRLFDFIYERGIAGEFLVIPPSFPESEVVKSLAMASWKRKREFAAGRLAAKKALASFGVVADVIPQCQSGLPVWPSGSVGSISHSSTHACAIASDTTSFKSLGIDIEP
ncbi:MAG: 4'-phosphopantetheinyl transferase, partial [Proteobacteria bacterium]|nr:4'-phosphopantetheinyl transferase [Pseudomonadota bacterium]